MSKVHQMRAATLQRTRNRIRFYRRFDDWPFEPMAPKQWSFIRLLDHFAVVFEMTGDDELETWFLKHYEESPELALAQAGRVRVDRNWPPARSTLERAFRLTVLSVILGRDISSALEMTKGEVQGIADVFSPVIDARGIKCPIFSTEAYLFCRSLLMHNGLLMAQFATVPLL